jgi:AhpD family alkylhydroperoxidase
MHKLTAQFQKRFYTPRALGRDALGLLAHAPELLSALLGRRLNRSFAEKIMLAVTQVNDCRYCAHVHIHTARRAGVGKLEVESLLSGRSEDFPEEEEVALDFARHYARTGGQPGPEAWRALRGYYGAPVARDILSYIRLIYFANLSGNAVDAFLSRLKGHPAPRSSPFSEACLFVLLAPFTLPLLPLMARARNRPLAGRNSKEVVRK